MPTINLPSVEERDDLQEQVYALMEAYERLRKEMTWLLERNLDTKNAREFAGWRIRPDKMISDDGDVGMSTEDTGNDDVRFFAGPDGEFWFFYVTKSGKLYATDAFITGKIEGSKVIGSEIMTAEEGTYPRAVMSAIGNLFAAQASATNSMTMFADYFGEVILRILGSGVTGQILSQSGKLLIQTALNSGDIQISSGGHLELFVPSFGPSKYVKVNSWSKFVNDDTGWSLQQELNWLQGQIDDLYRMIP